MQLGTFNSRGRLEPLDGRLEFGKGPEHVTVVCRLHRSHTDRKQPVYKAPFSHLENCAHVHLTKLIHFLGGFCIKGFGHVSQ